MSPDRPDGSNDPNDPNDHSIGDPQDRSISDPISNPISDPGLQPERTALAWRRTGLSVGIGALVSMRVLPPRIGPAGYLIGVLAALAAMVLMAQAERSRRHGRRALAADLRGERQNPLPFSRFGQTGVVVAMTTGAALSFGVLGLLLVIDLARSGND